MARKPNPHILNVMNFVMFVVCLFAFSYVYYESSSSDWYFWPMLFVTGFYGVVSFARLFGGKNL